MLRTTLVLFALALPATAQSKISTVVAPGYGDCLYGPSAYEVRVDQNSWQIRFESYSSGHDMNGWIHESFVLIGPTYSNVLGVGLVQPVLVLGAWQPFCWGDLETTTPWLPGVTAYAQFVGRMPGCRNEVHAGPITRFVTRTTPRH